MRKNPTPAEILRRAKDALRSGGFTDLGGYPLYCIAYDGEALSIEAVRENWKSIVRATLQHDRSDWEIIGTDINWDDDNLICAHTGEEIPCAYPPEEEDSEDDPV